MHDRIIRGARASSFSFSFALHKHSHAPDESTGALNDIQHSHLRLGGRCSAVRRGRLSGRPLMRAHTWRWLLDLCLDVQVAQEP